MQFVKKIKIFFSMMCVVHYSLISQAFSYSIIMWTSYPWLTMWLNLIYTSYCFTLLRCNVALSSFTFDTFFGGWNWTWKLCESNNFHLSLLFWNYFHPYIQPIGSFIQKIRIFWIIIQKFIHVPHSSKYFIIFVIFIHLHMVFI